MSTATQSGSLETLSGLVERVTYHNAETGYCVLKVKVKGQKDFVTLVGYVQAVSPGESIQASGEWVNNRQYGLQFKASFLKPCAPVSEDGMIKYLGSGLIKGLGPVYAQKLVAAFGDSVFEVIEQRPERLQNVPGIGPHRAQMIIKGWQDQKAIREIMVFLYQHGISTARATRIYKTYGNQAIRIILEDPWCLARDIRGIGFKSADQVAQKIGIPLDSPLRARAGLAHILLQASEEGHCGLPEMALVAQVVKDLDIPLPVVQKALHDEIFRQELISDSLEEMTFIFLKHLYSAEASIARLLKNLAAHKLPWNAEDLKTALIHTESLSDIVLANSQKEALGQALTSKVMVITGGPGVGKTTLVKSFLKILSSQNLKIILCAPTGRAAKRLSETTGREAKTIHRLLEMDSLSRQFRRHTFNPLEGDVVVVDEVSMIDVLLMNALLKAVPLKASLLLVGDVDQLPSVGPGDVLASLLDSGVFPVARLTEIFRQSSESQIILNAHRINQGLMPLERPSDWVSDFYFIPASDPDDCRRKIIDVVCHRIPKKFKMHPLLDIQVLCPMNRGGVGAQALNSDLQQALTPQDGATGPRVERFGISYRVGDKVMQTANNYDKDVYNGDIGFVRQIDPETEEVVLDFQDREVVYDFSELDEINLAYATTIHKSQGSEYPVVVIPLMMQHFPMLKRNLIYTGMTRGKKLVVIIGEKKALGMAVKNQQARKRHTKLQEWLRS